MGRSSAAHGLGHRLRVGRNIGGRHIGGVGHAQPAAGANLLDNIVIAITEHGRLSDQHLYRHSDRRAIKELRADMSVQPQQVQARRIEHQLGGSGQPAKRQAKLRVGPAGGNMSMSMRVDAGGHPQQHALWPLAPRAQGGKLGQLIEGIDHHRADLPFNRALKLCACLRVAMQMNPLKRQARPPSDQQLGPRDRIKAQALLGHNAGQGRSEQGLAGIVNPILARVMLTKSLLIGPHRSPHGRLIKQIERRPVRSSQRDRITAANLKLPINYRRRIGPDVGRQLAHATPARPSRSALARRAAITSPISSSSGTPSSSAPRIISSRLTLAAKALSLNFLRTELTSTL